MKLLTSGFVALAAFTLSACSHHEERTQTAADRVPTTSEVASDDMMNDSVAFDDTMNDDLLDVDGTTSGTTAEDMAGTTSGTTATTAPAKSGDKTASSEKDSEASSIVNAANDAEIDAATIALQKAKNKEVKDFANMMIKEHKKNKEEQSKVMAQPGLNAKRTDTSVGMRKDAQTKLTELKAKSGAEFDKAYMDTQVKMHSDLLANLNDKLIPSAQNAEFRAYLEKTRDHVKKHLEHAEKLQASLK